MAKLTLTKQTTTLDGHSGLGNRPNINDGLDPTQLKARYDRDVNTVNTFINDTHIDEIQDSTEGTSGSFGVGHGSPNITADNVGDALEELQGQFTDKQDVDNLVTAFQVTPDNTHYPSEKLVKDSLDALDASKADKSNVLELDNTDAFTPDSDYEPSTKKYVDDTVAGVVLGQIPDRSLTNIKIALNTLLLEVLNDEVKMTSSMGGII